MRYNGRTSQPRCENVFIMNLHVYPTVGVTGCAHIED